MSLELLAADTAARTLALSALDRTLLVEAGAGSGKTSVLAGRVTSLLAAGHAPREIAAITFTELAAAELRERVCAFVAEVASGRVRDDLRTAFPNGPSPTQRAALVRARDGLDELRCTTIHGFCQRLLTPYPVEAGMDPGATIMDRDAAEVMFGEIVDAWLRERLSGEQRPDDLLVALYVDDAGATDKLVRDLARSLLQHRGASVPELDMLDDALHELRAAVKAFRAFLTGAPCIEPETGAIVSELEELLRAAPGSGHETAVLLHLLRLPVPSACSTASGGFTVYRRKGKWQTALKASQSKVQADMLNDGAGGCYATCRAAHDAARSYAAGRILQTLAGELRPVLERFERSKRDAALIDFDDLMVKARDLLAGNPTVRTALGRRFTAVLVDEFQDTDRLQCEILWRLCAEAPDETVPWSEWPLRSGSLFLVGDPKQAIYRFRGADVASYVATRDRLTAVDTSAQVVIAQNFRSFGTILNWVNVRFEAPLSMPFQPGFAKLFTGLVAPDGHVAVATLPIEVLADVRADGLRDAEAEAVAAVCARVIGSLRVRGREGPRSCRPDDIALLAPTGTDLWRYERALEALGISVSTQAGKGFYRRQEVHDLIALTRVLADARDTLALGALLRGPLVGMTEEDLLDVVGTLPDGENGPGRLFLWTPIEDVRHLLLRETLAILQALARQAHSTTPFVLLCQAVEELQVRPLLRRRQDRTAERALANLDQFLEAARPFDIRGLHAFATVMKAQWADAQRAMEGRPDTEQQSVSLVTMHSSKGLEWPVVIPINTGGQVKSSVSAALDANGVLHLPVFGLHGPGGAAALQAEREEQERERHRMWYVAATRARDLLLLSDYSIGIPKGSWMERVGLSLEGLLPFNTDGLDEPCVHRTEELANAQTRALFEVEAALIVTRTHRIARVTPHLAEAGEEVPAEAIAGGEQNLQPSPPRGSLARGQTLHKLLEEILTGETADDPAVLEQRAADLAFELGTTPGAIDLDAAEVARTVLRGLAMPQISAMRARLVPECWIAHSTVSDGAEQVTLGIADAVVREPDGRISLVVDWKSDVDPAPATIAQYRSQLGAYLHATGADRGIIVFLTSNAVEKLELTG